MQLPDRNRCPAVLNHGHKYCRYKNNWSILASANPDSMFFGNVAIHNRGRNAHNDANCDWDGTLL